MTKDEAIEVLRGALERGHKSLASAAMSQTKDGEAAWVAMGEALKDTATIESPTSEAVAEKLANEYVSGTVVSDFHGPKVTLRYQTTAAAESAFEALTDAIGGKISAQPAADPAPVPAQGIDHDKRAEGFASFEDWLASDIGPTDTFVEHARKAFNAGRTLVSGHARLMDGGQTFEQYWASLAKDGSESADLLMHCEFAARNAWQARGQQAGVPEAPPLYSTRLAAARYRFIRENSYVEVLCNSPRVEGWSPVILDAAIDRAIAAAAAPGEAG